MYIIYTIVNNACVYARTDEHAPNSSEEKGNPTRRGSPTKTAPGANLLREIKKFRRNRIIFARDRETSTTNENVLQSGGKFLTG